MPSINPRRSDCQYSMRSRHRDVVDRHGQGICGCVLRSVDECCGRATWNEATLPPDGPENVPRPSPSQTSESGMVAKNYPASLRQTIVEAVPRHGRQRSRRRAFLRRPPSPRPIHLCRRRCHADAGKCTLRNGSLLAKQSIHKCTDLDRSAVPWELASFHFQSPYAGGADQTARLWHRSRGQLRPRIRRIRASACPPSLSAGSFVLRHPPPSLARAETDTEAPYRFSDTRNRRALTFAPNGAPRRWQSVTCGNLNARV